MEQKGSLQLRIADGLTAIILAMAVTKVKDRNYSLSDKNAELDIKYSKNFHDTYNNK